MRKFKLSRSHALSFAAIFGLIIKSGFSFFVALAYMVAFFILVGVLVFENIDQEK